MQVKAHRKPEANIDLSGEEQPQNIDQPVWNQQGCRNKAKNVFHYDQEGRTCDGLLLVLQVFKMIKYSFHEILQHEYTQRL